MSKLISLLNKNPMTLIVSLPANTVELALAAQEAGADAVVARIDADTKDRNELLSLVEKVKVPVGVEFAGEPVNEVQLNGFQKKGFDFFINPLNGMPVWMLGMKGLGKVAAMDPEYSAYDITGISNKAIDAIDAAVIPESDYGKDLTVGDLQHYITIALSTGIPVIVPTQKLVRVSEVPIIWDTGAKGIILKDVVSGSTAKSLSSVTKEFKKAIDSLKEEE